MRLHEFRAQCAQADLQHKKEVRRAVISILTAMVAAIILFQFVCGVAIIRGSSMLPGLKDGAVVLYIKRTDLNYGDVAVLHDTDDSVVIKRVIGVSGDKINVDSSGRCTLNGLPLNEPYAKYAGLPTNDGLDVDIEPGRVFVMGDNRAESVDSRTHGTYSMNRIKGRVILLIESL